MNRQSELVVQRFRQLVAERALSSDLMVKVIVMTMAALWHATTFRSPSKPASASSAPSPKKNNVQDKNTKPFILAHSLNLFRTLMQIGISEMNEEPLSRDTSEGNLAQNITATFRRTLPSVRIVSKWVLSNFDYIQRSGSPSSGSTSPAVENGQPDLADALRQFWFTYASLCTEMLRMFPLNRLPTLSTFLEEDLEVKGFTPLKGFMPGGSAQSTALGQNMVHPNEEQLMRIGDLFADANELVSREVGSYYHNFQIAVSREDCS